MWSHDLYIHSHSEESATLLTPVWEHISNFPNLPSPLSMLFLATFDFLPTQILLNADASLRIFSLAVFWFFYTSSCSKLPHCSCLQTLYHNHYWQTIAEIQTMLTMHKSCTDVYKDYSHPDGHHGALLNPPPMRHYDSSFRSAISRCAQLPELSVSQFTGESNLIPSPGGCIQCLSRDLATSAYLNGSEGPFSLHSSILLGLLR